MSELLIARCADAAGTRPAPAPPPDEELLRRFTAARDERAFAALVGRHGPLVMAVCRRVLGSEQDAEDAFQAAFLVLARKASSLRHAPSLPAWLYRTAHRIALRARASAARRREQQLESEAMIPEPTLSHIAAEYDPSVLDEELNRLPEKYRLPLFLCAVEGKSREEAAEQLGWSLGSLKGRLERGRQVLRRRLVLRGATLSVALAATAYVQSAQGAVPASLVASTAHAGAQYAAGQSAAGYVSEEALTLAHGSFQVMPIATFKMVACSCAAAGALAWGATWLPAPAVAGGGGGAQIELQGSAEEEAEHLIAFQAEDDRPASAEESAEREVRRDGDRPREAGPRDGEGPPRRGPRDGEGPPRGPRDGEGPPRVGPRDGEGPPSRGPRDGEGPPRGPRDGERGPQDGFRPQSPQEGALFQMILQLRREVAELRREIAQIRGRGEGPFDRPPREGDRPREGFREREREGDRPREGFREREREGDRPRVEDREREGERPQEAEREGGRSPEADREREGDQPRAEDRERESDRPREGERDDA